MRRSGRPLSSRPSGASARIDLPLGPNDWSPALAPLGRDDIERDERLQSQDRSIAVPTHCGEVSKPAASETFVLSKVFAREKPAVRLADFRGALNITECQRTTTRVRQRV